MDIYRYVCVFMCVCVYVPILYIYIFLNLLINFTYFTFSSLLTTKGSFYLNEQVNEIILMIVGKEFQL